MLKLNNAPVFFPETGQIEAHIIHLENHKVSKELTERCVNSLEKINMPYNIWPAMDGTNGENIKLPEHLKEEKHISWIKQSNNKLSKSEVALFLTHYSLWAHCCTINKPIVVLEHDAIMVKPYTYHKYPNTIYYLGHSVQKNNEVHLGWNFENDSYFYIAYTHAYAIDPAAARNLLSHAIRFGITHPVDNFMRMDVFTVVQDDFYAYEENGEGTVIRS